MHLLPFCLPCRPAMLKAGFGSADDKHTYTTSADQRPHFYRVAETLLQRNEAAGRHAVGSSPSFADAVLFAVLWDDVALFGEDQALMTAFPKLHSFYRCAAACWCRTGEA